MVGRWRVIAIAAVIAVTGAGTVERGLAAASRIGVTSAVRNQVDDVTGGGAKKLLAGSQLFQQQIVRTGPESAAQLLFLDETSLSLGPKAQVTLDKFVFDPNKPVGSVVLSATKGAFRFVSGAQDPHSYTIKTPVATIGTRGTIVDCYNIPPPSVGLFCIVQEGMAIIGGHVVHAGQAIYISADHVATGPFTPDGRFYAVSGIFPFPLYGQDLGEVVKHLDVGDDPQDLIDQILSENGPPQLPEPPPSCATDPSLCPVGDDTGDDDDGPSCNPEDCECSNTCGE